MAEHKRHRDVPKERFLESFPRSPSCTTANRLRIIAQPQMRNTETTVVED